MDIVSSCAGIILCMCLASERRRYIVRVSLIGCTHTSLSCVGGIAFPWLRHYMETRSELLALCMGIPFTPVDSLHKRPALRSFDVFFVQFVEEIAMLPVIWHAMWRHFNATRLHGAFRNLLFQFTRKNHDLASLLNLREYVVLLFALRTCLFFLTHWGLVTPYGDRDLGQHWLSLWLVAWRHQAITWTNVDLSVRSSDIHVRANSQEITQP